MGKVADSIRNKMSSDGKRFWADDNVSEYMSDETRRALIDEATSAFEDVLDCLLIDRSNN